MITILHRGGGSLGSPKSDYVICARPLIKNLPQDQRTVAQLIKKRTNSLFFLRFYDFQRSHLNTYICDICNSFDRDDDEMA